MSARFDLNTLRLFIAVAEEGSISKAAEREHIVASAVSKRISDFERGHGVSLFKRYSRGIILTATGQALLQHSRNVLRDLAQLEGELLEHSQGLKGQVRLFATSTVILRFLPKQLVSFLSSYPLVQIEVDEGISPIVLKSVAENIADIGICSFRSPNLGLHFQPYRDDWLSVVVPWGHPIGRRSSVKFADIADYDFVALQAGSSIDALTERAANDLGKILKFRIRMTSFDALCRMIEAGLGIGLVPGSIAAHYARTMKLAQLDLNEPWARRALNLISHEPSELPLAARLLLNHLADPTT